MPGNARWVPLECNPEVFNGWATQAGLEPSDQFYDLYGLDPELLSATPRPVKAVIFVFPYSEARGRRVAEDERLAKEGGPRIDENVFWMKQTIPDACGAMALIHSLANTDITLTPDSPLRVFLDDCRNKPVPERSKLLEDSPAFAEIHASVSGAGQSAVPAGHPDQGYCAFISAPGEGSTARRVIELDGTRAGPVDRGECTDLLGDVARIVKEEFMDKNSSVLYSMLYLGQPM
ncbi:putative ubiquitin carboxyl-terminal hydrolase [Lyophyllum shimeji]|uniref:Ubiquitin carboxyl-terminal hydrolase n=1 Tax=Lyophyllum shimeji TaxID=47721 RepID=A0A9P3PKD7_LYOSH|nr:putative ubiquitin carboxyl-terminal hydrolase [Lyophyllum shimeji]